MIDVRYILYAILIVNILQLEIVQDFLSARYFTFKRIIKTIKDVPLRIKIWVKS